MLQEANLLREWAMSQSRDFLGKAVDRSTVEAACGTAEEVLLRAIELVQIEQGNDSLEAQLLVELASLKGVLSRFALEGFQDPSFAIDQFMEVRSCLQDARRLDPIGYHSLDVLAWSSMYVLASQRLGRVRKLDALYPSRHGHE